MAEAHNGNVKRAILAAILERRAIIEEMQDRLEKAENLIDQSTCEAGDKLDSQSALDLARELYWNWGSDVKTKSLCTLLGLKSTNQVCRVVGPIEIIAQCKGCKKDYKHTFNSRSELGNYEVSYRIRDYLSHYCDECQARRKAERESKWRARRERYEQRLIQLCSMPYQEYLRTAEWEETRERALKRAGYHCSICNAGKCELHVHHRSYQNLGQETNRDVIVLCKDCHKLFHEQSSVKS